MDWRRETLGSDKLASQPLKECRVEIQRALEAYLGSREVVVHKLSVDITGRWQRGLGSLEPESVWCYPQGEMRSSVFLVSVSMERVSIKWKSG